MTYRKVYFRIRTDSYASGWSSDADRAAFHDETRCLFQNLGWTLYTGRNGGCDIVTKGQQDLYLHPTSFSGVIDEANIQSLQEQLSKARTFRYYALDCYEEYLDMSDEDYLAALEAKRDEIIAFTLKRYSTKRSNLYITEPMAPYIAKHFEICRLCDKGRNNAVGLRFMSELVEHLLQKGKLIAAETTHGKGIRATTAKELKKRRQPVEQVNGQITMTSCGEALKIGSTGKKIQKSGKDR